MITSVHIHYSDLSELVSTVIQHRRAHLLDHLLKPDKDKVWSECLHTVDFRMTARKWSISYSDFQKGLPPNWAPEEGGAINIAHQSISQWLTDPQIVSPSIREMFERHWCAPTGESRFTRILEGYGRAV